jgi:hypothetical protein
MPGKRMRGIKRPAVYERLKSRGVPKRIAAAIANKGKSRAGRKKMARKAARTRRRG